MINKFFKNSWLFKNNCIVKLQHQIYLAEFRGNIQLAKKFQVMLLNNPLLKQELVNFNINRRLTKSSIRNVIEAKTFQTILEPVWETRFSPTSYGSRPARSCYDSIIKIKNILSKNSFYFYKIQFELVECQTNKKTNCLFHKHQKEHVSKKPSIVNKNIAS